MIFFSLLSFPANDAKGSKEYTYNSLDNNSSNYLDSPPVLVASSEENKKDISTTTEPNAIPSNVPHNTQNNPYVYLSDDDRQCLRNKYGECYLPTIRALNKWNMENPDYKYSAGLKGFENFVMKQGLKQPRKDGLSEGSVIARI